MVDLATQTEAIKTALILYPDSQAYVVQSLRKAFIEQLPDWRLLTDRAQLEQGQKPDLQWSDYDELDWDWAMDEKRLLNSFAIRKAYGISPSLLLLCLG